MNINRHNYETFFLLYVDKELSATDRKAVELFVAENTDLSKELLMLQQTVIVPDMPAFDRKQLLLKKQKSSALQENLLLLIDDELSATDKKELQQLIAADHVVAKEWDMFQQAKLPAETIAFADKRSLYKKESARIAGLNWKKLAAAAVFIALITWGGWQILISDSTETNTGNEIANSHNDTRPARSKTGEKDIITDKGVTDTNSPIDDAAGKNIQDDQVAATVPTKKNNKVKTISKDNTSTQKDIKDDAVKDADITMSLSKKETNDLPTPLYNNINNNPRNNSMVTTVPPEKVGNERGDPQKGIALADNNNIKGSQNMQNGTSFIARTTTLNEGQNNSFIDTDGKKRSRIGGFLRKVSRMITRNTNIPEADGKRVKIAGFDIAIN